MPTLSGSVGEGGANHRSDVRLVQRLLNQHSLPPLRKLKVDGIAGPNTVDAIRHFQSVRVGMRNPDGRVDPAGRTMRSLRGVRSGGAQDPNQSGATSRGTDRANGNNLSGEKWWRANQRHYPNSRQIDDLEADFGHKVKRFVSALRKGGATVNVSSTLRNRIRAHLMHYSWKVARGDVSPDRVPSTAGLDIEWDHGDLRKSRNAAQQMVNLFNMAHIASLTSNHIRGTAIDMTITWTGELTLDVPGMEDQVTIRGGPRNGNRNRELHRIGSEFGVLKLWKDPPHWSHNGR